MRSFQAALAFLMAAMANMALAAPGIYATAMILATTLVDTVLSSGFQHSVVAVPGHVHPRQASPSRTNYETGCFNTSTFTPAGGGNSTLVSWTALTNENDPQSDLAVYNAFTTLCKKISATILTRNIPYNHCEPDKYTNGTYGIIAQMMYLGPQDVFDMRGNYDLCMGVMSLPHGCTCGGLFEEVYFFYTNSPNKTQYCNIQARPILGPCPDCTGGLLA
ncbi:hypothetical protein LA080_015812 [Diaporthe eres]|uniref:Uncharacterized protein n=1 Tax=Diaporthe vaccinii TaxID=105482 RepID=A0ABR4EW48_9PEZI|nr:hypothetical protein LA080_015812 [Diaporthe eres]